MCFNIALIQKFTKKMFSLKKLLFQRSTLGISTSLIRHAKTDPGIGIRQKLVSLDENEAEITDLGDFETDFMDVHKSHKEHMRELQLLKEKEKYQIVKQKYFKEKFPNFLTWHDKEQIRYLHRTDPNEWTIERLSEGFPALPEVIQKIVKGNWVKSKQNKITNHDNRVQRNWKLFKEGQMSDLPEHLVEHLKKFTTRDLIFTPFIMPSSQKSTLQVKNNVGTEFSDIITSYKKLKAKDSPIIEETHVITKNQSNPPLSETYLTSKVSPKKVGVTLDALRTTVKEKIEVGNNLDEEDKLIMMNLQEQVEEGKTQLIDLTQTKYQGSSEVQTYIKKSDRDLSHLNYPEKISIPKKVFKKGFIYKLNDCYYDDDGEFLYRVPGMD